MRCRGVPRSKLCATPRKEPHRVLPPASRIACAWPCTCIGEHHSSRSPMRMRTSRVAHAGIEELVAAPGIGCENGLEAVASADRRIGEAARRRRQDRRAAAAMPLCADARCIDPAAGTQNLPGRQHIVGTGGKRILRLVGDRGAHAARAERIEHECGDADAGQCLRMRQMRGRDAQAAGDHDDERQRTIARRGRWQKQLAVDDDARHVRRPADGLVVVARVGGGNIDVVPDAAVGKGDAAIAETVGRCSHGDPPKIDCCRTRTRRTYISKHCRPAQLRLPG